jgi:hypothetical protein
MIHCSPTFGYTDEINDSLPEPETIKKLLA